MANFIVHVVFLLFHFTEQKINVKGYYPTEPAVFSTHTESMELKHWEKKCAKDPTTDTRCGCDPKCSKYGDCCPDSDHFKQEEQKLGASLATCHSIFQPSFYVISRCPSAWDEPKIRQLCEQPDASYRNPMLDTLITSLRTNVTYRNSHCASCHQDLHQDMVLWPLHYKCFIAPSHIRNLESSQFFQNMFYDESDSHWYLNLSGIEVDPSGRYIYCAPCSISFSIDQERHTYVVNCSSPPPVYFDKGTKVSCILSPELTIPVPLEGRLRYCGASISTCDPTWNDTSERLLCEAYTAQVHVCYKVYRNYHCALCNYDVMKPSICYPEEGMHSLSKPTFSLLLDWRKVEQCGEMKVLDSLSGQCRDIASHPKERIMESSSCTNVTFSPEEYIFDQENTTVFIRSHNETYNDFFIQEDVLILCLSEKSQRRHAPELGYITVIGLSLSISCIVLHLTVLCIVPKLLNLPAMNLASLCVSLLFLYSNIIASGLVTPRTDSCVAVAIFIHYSLLASFFWMFIISFDIFSMTRRTKTKLIASKGLQLRRFWLYSASGWLTPILIVGFALVLDYQKPMSSFAPGYGIQECWFNRSGALLVFCLSPLIVVMCLNVVFFFWTNFLIRQMTQFTNTSVARKNFSLNLRLFIIMGLTWITGIIAAFINVEGLWHLFVVLNTMQGVFIFIAFTCTKNTLQELYNLFSKRMSASSTGSENIKISNRTA